jgi:type IV pilus assembly protein PilA
MAKVNNKILLGFLKGDRSNDSGYSLIELVVVVVIIGILAAISAPSFLNQIARARQSQAQINIGSVNDAQKQWRATHNSFAENLDDLALGIAAITNDYNYQITATTATRADFTATSNDPTVTRSFAGTVAIVGGQAFSVTCQSIAPSAIPPTPIVIGNQLTCGANSEPIN